MEIIRLKDKLGTQQLPTAEILLKGTEAHLISDDGTTNVLCYDFVRALMKKQNSIFPLDSIVKFFTKSFETIGTGETSDKTFISSNK